MQLQWAAVVCIRLYVKCLCVIWMPSFYRKTNLPTGMPSPDLTLTDLNVPDLYHSVAIHKQWVYFWSTTLKGPWNHYS